ncbi:hypothetical protein RI129_003118 [Pyrocoelia pectoralis]|uniref:Uncharacterized protein n=1 Tax=Pyrocoelia pectoralis TaxID=417401 RepID=A0AAN7VP44_9COLE
MAANLSIILLYNLFRCGQVVKLLTEDLGILRVKGVLKEATRIVIGRSPYKAVFGTDFSVGLSSSAILPEMIQRINTEEEYEEVLNEEANNKTDNANPEHSISNNENSLPIEDNIKLIENAEIIFALKMLNNTSKKFATLNLGENVRVIVPKIDRGPLDPKNIIGVVMNIENGVYKVGTKYGIIKRWLSRNELAPIEINEIQNNQNFMAKGLKASKKQCAGNKCYCFKAKLKCSSKCHASGMCF